MSYFLLDETKEKTIEEGREAYNYTWGWHRTGKSRDILVLTHTHTNQTDLLYMNKKDESTLVIIFI